MTNSLSVLSEVDEIVMLENGSIVANGSYKDLMNQNEKFTEFVSNYFYSSDKREEVVGQTKEKSKSKTKDLIEEEENDDDFKIIKSEKIVSGNVKFKNLLDFFRSSSFVLVAVHFFNYVLHHAVNAMGNFWLSDWSNKVI